MNFWLKPRSSPPTFWAALTPADLALALGSVLASEAHITRRGG
ncbi:MAG: phage tail assembly chaperone [Treponema sp.]|nr:phage tail assembly chaperone [Treponema sp.]